MFTIEIATGSNGCGMKCHTCPASIQSMHGSHADQMSETVRLLQDKLGETPFGVSVMTDYTKVILEIERFGIKNAKEITSFVQLPFDVTKFKEFLGQISERFPNVVASFGTLHKAITVSDSVIPSIVEMAQCFFESKLSTIQMTLDNNAMPQSKFLEQRTSMMGGDEVVHKKIIDLVGGFSFKKYTYNEADDFDGYNCGLLLQKEEKSFQFTRRIISHRLLHPSLMLEYYRMKAKEDVVTGGYFTPQTLTLTLTPIGVRINHRAYDVSNPYLWITYDELHRHIRDSSSLKMFCSDFRTIINMTLSLDLDESRISNLTEETIHYVASERKKKFTWM